MLLRAKISNDVFEMKLAKGFLWLIGVYGINYKLCCHITGDICKILSIVFKGTEQPRQTLDFIAISEV